MKKILILMLAFVLATAMLVSCSDDSAYTEVLESNGAFSYNGKSYNSLEEVIVAISGSKAVNYDATTEFDHTITLTRDVVTRSAKIAVDGSIVLDLNGYTMQLEDTSDAAITVSNGTFCIKNGTVKFNDSSSTAALIKANNEARVEFQGDANIVGNIVVDNASVYSYDNAVFEGDVTLDGNASFSTYSDENTTISTLTLPEGTSLNVGTTATVNGVDGDIEGDITAAEGAEITSDDESLATELNEKIVEGVYYVESGSGKIYYASIAKAIEQGETKITQQYDDENSNNNLSADIEIVTSKNLTIDSITLSSGKTITLSGVGTVSTVKGSADGTVAISGTTTVSEITCSKATVKVTGTKTAMPTIGNVDAAIFTAEYANINGDVETSGTQSYTNVVFGVEANEASDTAAIVPALTSTAAKDAITIADSTGTVGAVTAKSSSITITDSRVSGNTLTTGTLTANTVTVTGNEKVMPSIGGVAATSVEATYATIAGDVTTTGTQSYNNAVFKNEDVDLTSNVAVIKDVQAAIVITNSTGTVGSIKTKAFEVSEDSAINSIVIDNSSVNAVLTVGTLEAYTEATEAYGDVIVTGAENYPVTVDNVAVADLTAKYATFTGDVKVANDVVSSGSKFTGIISATNVIDGASDVGSKFSGVVNTTGTQSYNGSVFVDEPKLTSTATKLEEGSEAAILITNSTGKVGSIKTEAFTYSDNGSYSIIINNSEASASLTTGMLSANTSTTSNDDNNVESNIYGDISVTGKSSNRADVIVIGSMSNNFTVKYAQVSGEVFASSKLTSSYSLFSNAYVHASVIYDGDKDDSASGSTLDGSIFYPGQIYLYYSEFTNASNIESEGSVYMVNVLGEAGSIESDSSDISIINEEATSLFTVATINKDHDDNDIRGNVSVSGNASYLPVIGDVKADSMMAEYAKITGTVDTYDNQSYLRTTFSGASALKSKGAVYLEDVKGIVANVEATTIIIDNTNSVADFTTGTLSATEDITVTGNTSYKPIITHVEKAADLKVEYAKVVGEVSTSGTQVYTNVEFINALSLVSSAIEIGIDDAAAIVIESSYGTVGDITANGTVENTDILAEGSSIKIDASAIEDLLSTGKLSAKTVEVVGNADYMPSIGGVDSEDKFEASYVEITGDVTTDGIQKYSNVKFAKGEENSEAPKLVSTVTTIGYYDEAAIYISESIGDIGDITANHSIKIETSEKFDEKLTTGVLSAQTVTVIGKSKSKPAIGGVKDTTDFVVNDAIIAGAVETSGTQVYTNVEFVNAPALTTSIQEVYRDKATKAAIHIDNSIGTVGAITASNSSILIDASKINTLLSTGTLTAMTATINGNPDIMPNIGGVSGVTNFIVSDVTITGDVTTDGIQKYTNVVFSNEYSEAPKLVSNATVIGVDDKAAIEIESSTGTVGAITAAESSIKINANAYKNKLITGKLTAETVIVDGNAKTMPTIGGIVCVDDFTVSDVIIAGNVETSGLQQYTNVVFEGAPNLNTEIEDSERIKAAGAAIYIDNSIGTVGNITTSDTSVLIDASQINTLLKTGFLTAKTVTINGNPDIMPNIGGVSGVTNFIVSDVTITGNVETSGIQKYTNVEFINAPSLKSSETAIGIDDEAAIVIESSTGIVGDIIATHSIKIDADGIKKNLITGKLSAPTVTVNGYAEKMPTIGSVGDTTDFVVNDAIIAGGVTTTDFVVNDAIIAGGVTTTGIQKYTNVEFINAPSLKSSATAIGIDDEAAIEIKLSYGTVGNITANGTVDNTEIFAEGSSIKISANGIEKKLITGTLSAKTVTVVGNTGKMPTIGGVVCVDDFTVSDVIIAGEVSTKGLQKYTNVVFEGAPDINTKIADSEFTKAADAAIHISLSTGVVGNISASNSSILVDASGVSEKLWIGTLSAKKKVTVKGTPKIRPSIGDVEATEFDVNATDFVVNDAIIAGNVTTSGIQEYTNVVFEGSPELKSAIADDNLPRGVHEAIYIGNSTGTVGDITAAVSSIKIDNSDANEVLATGILKAKTVTVTGNSVVLPSVGGVDATSVEATYATIAGDVTTTGTQSYTNVKFKESDDNDRIDLVSSANSLVTDETAIYISKSTGSIGTITTNGRDLFVDQTNAKANLDIGYINTIKDENRGDVTITSASTENITTTIGSIYGGNITLTDSRALAGSKSATLIIDGDDSIKAYGTLNIYGGKYGVASTGIDFGSGSEYNTTINVYMGTFYVDDEPNFQKVAENLRNYNVDNYPGFVEILLNENITLASEVQIGGWENSTEYIGNKPVLIAGSNDIRKITIPYFLKSNEYSKNYSLHFHSGIYELSSLDFVGNKINTEPDDEDDDYYYYDNNPVVSILIVFESNASLAEGSSFSTDNGILIQ